MKCYNILSKLSSKLSVLSKEGAIIMKTDMIACLFVMDRKVNEVSNNELILYLTRTGTYSDLF